MNIYIYIYIYIYIFSAFTSFLKGGGGGEALFTIVVVMPAYFGELQSKTTSRRQLHRLYFLK